MIQEGPVVFAVSIRNTLLITHGRWEVIFLWWNKIFAVGYEQWLLVFSSTLHPYILPTFIVPWSHSTKAFDRHCGSDSENTIYQRETLASDVRETLSGSWWRTSEEMTHCNVSSVVTKRSMPPFRSRQEGCLSSDEGLTLECAAGELFCRRVCELDGRWIEDGMIAELKRIILREALPLDQTSSRWIQHCNSLLPEPSTVHRVSGEQGSIATVFPCMVSVWSPFQTEVSRSYFRHSRRLLMTHVNMLHIYYDVHKLKKCWANKNSWLLTSSS